jgi:hypothetical protein
MKSVYRLRPFQGKESWFLSLLKNLFNLKEKPMTQDQYGIRRQLNILGLDDAG